MLLDVTSISLAHQYLYLDLVKIFPENLLRYYSISYKQQTDIDAVHVITVTVNYIMLSSLAIETPQWADVRCL